MIREAHGNLLTADVDALVNTVNTVGVMGKGIALQFKQAYPEMFRAYERASKAGELIPGHMHVWETGALEGPRFVINFPTKRHWRGPSKLEYVREGLDDLVRTVGAYGIRSLAVPPLGCGNGGLQWSDVEPLIASKLRVLPIEVVVYAPSGTPEASAMIERRPRPQLTPGRIALLRIMRAYQELTLEAPSVVEIQKLMYFMQECGQPLKLRYVKGCYGPYADNLRQVLAEVEGHFISGFGDGSAKVNEAEPLNLLPQGVIAAEESIDDGTRRRIERVLDLAEGYSSAYGLELLASTHWIAVHDQGGAAGPDAVVNAIHAWTSRKEGLFRPEHIRRAWDALAQRDWLPKVGVMAGAS